MNVPGMNSSNTGNAKPTWLAPVLIIAVIVGLIAVGRKHERAIENPLVDLVIITVGVFAFAAVFRVLALKLNNPGLASFFGARTPAATTNITQ